MVENVRMTDADGTAALGICESLLLALTELKIITDQETRDLLTDVATAHRNAAKGSATPEKHDAVAGILEKILAGKNGIRP